ncbi:MAG: RDD family protein [Lentisphaeraceae bacterium]|nr:RDD family protein [Lentisphaeraceae bacterium]
MDYIIKDRSGKESAPINESLLKDMARRGDISPKDQIRNSMVSDYKPASKVNCIKALLKNYKEVVDTPKIAKNLHRSIATINPPTLVFRLGATFIDTLILAVLILASFNFLRIFGSEFLEEGQQEALFLVSLFAIPLLYYTLTLGYKAQTVGFWYYGIMVISGE